MDWDKLKVFHAAAEAGSFTHAGEQLGLSQSAVSRQVGALEQELAVPLFHRHARGLILTEQGELLYRTAHDVLMKLEAARTKLTDSREKPNGELRVNTTPGLGVHWLTPRLGEFLDLYPDIRITLITTDQELDLAMREADVAIRLRPPTQPDLIQRKLFSMHFHAYASPEYLKRHGTPRTPEDLDHHRLLVLGGSVPMHLQSANWVIQAGGDGKGPRTPVLTINNVLGLLRACQRGLGVAMLPADLIELDGGVVQLFGPTDALAVDAYFVYAEELKSLARIQVIRDFLVSKAQRWHYSPAAIRRLRRRARIASDGDVASSLFRHSQAESPISCGVRMAGMRAFLLLVQCCEPIICECCRQPVATSSQIWQPWCSQLFPSGR